MVDVLDYSSGWPAPAAVKAAGYVGVVRYIGTPGRGKNLTRTEAQAMLAAGVKVGLVYEDTAGWMRGGRTAGVNAARASMEDAANCGVGLRCVYFACDEDVTDAQTMQAVQACLAGAASVLGLARTGVYGEADVIDACVPTYVAWGWQTRAWSSGRVSARARMLQQVGYVSVGGVQCDRNTVLNDDWGHWPVEDDMTQEQFDALTAQIGALYRLLSVGDARDDAPGGDPGGHPWNLEKIRADMSSMRSAITAGQARSDAAIAGLVQALAQIVAAGSNGLTEEQAYDVVTRALRENEVHVDISVQGTPAVPPAAPNV